MKRVLKTWWMFKFAEVCDADRRTATRPHPGLHTWRQLPSPLSWVLLIALSWLPRCPESIQNIYLSESFGLWGRARSHTVPDPWLRWMRTQHRVFLAACLCWVAAAFTECLIISLERILRAASESGKKWDKCVGTFWQWRRGGNDNLTFMVIQFLKTLNIDCNFWSFLVSDETEVKWFL